MNINRKTRHTGSFTLIEMMVVMIIIVMLSALLFPVVLKSWGRAAKRRAQAESASLVLAIKAYHSVFGKWPGQTSIADACFFTNNHIVTTQLMGFNPRSNSFINISTNALDSTSNYLDPAGIPYVIMIIQSGKQHQKISFTNYYLNERNGKDANYTLAMTNSTMVGVGAFMDSSNSLTVNSWSEF